MKRILVLFVSLFCFFNMISCDFNAPLRSKMLDYYGQDKNYIELSGIIKGITYRKNNELIIEVDLLNGTEIFSHNHETELSEFVLVNWSTYDFSFALSDTIIFSSAPMYFYNGHILPIVHIEKEGVVLLTIEKGKESYLNWIEKTFK